jgi:hypothetical protein
MVKKGNLISAKISDEAYEIYRRWANERKGGSMISLAIIYHESDWMDSAGKIREITTLEMNIRGLQKVISRFAKEIDELETQVADLFCPQKPE